MSFYIRFFLLTSLLLGACQTNKKNIPASGASNNFDMVAPSVSNQKCIHDSAQIFFQRQFGDQSFNGHFLVAKNGHILFTKSCGYADFEKGIKITPNTPIHVASISKVATALAVLRLVDQKKIRLNAKVVTYVKTFPYPNVTVRSLLNHRSGLPYYGYFTKDACKRNSLLSNDSILNILIKQKTPLNFPTNRKFAYSNTNFVILALIVEEVMGIPFPEAMNVLVFNPLKMKHSYVLSSNERYKKASKNFNANHFPYPFGYLDAI
jgi:CubicO group peptidase (beta-lactamase class C family)